MNLYLSEFGEKNKAQQSIEYAEKAILLAKEQIETLTSSMMGAKNKPMAVKSCNCMGNLYMMVSYKTRGLNSYSEPRNVSNTCTNAISHAKELFEKSKKLHEGNEKAIENNTALKSAIYKFMESIGIPTSYTTCFYKTNRSRTQTERKNTAGWVGDVSRVVKTDDGWLTAENHYKSFLKDIEKYRTEETKKEESAKKEADAVLAKDALVAEAIKYLTDNGKKVNEDFTLATAVKTADDIAFDIATEEACESHDFIDFNGNDYCENCKGWSPGEHRCDCGNRRVGFERGYSHSFKHPEIEAVAN